jgi:hypothetical protein
MEDKNMQCFRRYWNRCNCLWVYNPLTNLRVTTCVPEVVGWDATKKFGKERGWEYESCHPICLHTDGKEAEDGSLAIFLYYSFNVTWPEPNRSTIFIYHYLLRMEIQQKLWVQREGCTDGDWKPQNHRYSTYRLLFFSLCSFFLFLHRLLSVPSIFSPL